MNEKPLEGIDEAMWYVGEVRQRLIAILGRDPSLVDDICKPILDSALLDGNVGQWSHEVPLYWAIHGISNLISLRDRGIFFTRCVNLLSPSDKQDHGPLCDQTVVNIRKLIFEYLGESATTQFGFTPDKT